MAKRPGLQRSFLVFPGGLPGLGLLLLRITATTSAAGYAWLTLRHGTGPRTGIETLIALGAGALLAAGLLTTIAGLLLALGAAATAVSWIPSPGESDIMLAAMLTAAIAVAIILTGPGSYSIDARLFGRREIIIPRPTSE